ncbi:hypothetical protein [Piscibacillus salipiscarius]|uniref:hypothetical protein n=1 Tax=Piscibacillus salipiscarius TaxID=299480 RepID=UPI0034E1EE5D
MFYTHVLIGFVITFILTIAITPLVIYIAKKFGLVDRPNDRKKHNGEVPLLGGLAIIIPIIGGLLYYQPAHYGLTAILIGAALIIFLVLQMIFII